MKEPCAITREGGQPETDSIARISSDGSSRLLLARSCFMCSALDVPVKGRIPIERAKLKTI